MVSAQTRAAIQITAVVAIAVNAILNMLPSDTLGGHGPRAFSLIVLSATAAWFLWDEILWRLLIRCIPARRAELVHGTWRGRLESSWADPETGSVPSPKIAYLVIHQSFSRLRIRLITDEAQSTLLTGHMRRGDGRLQLLYIYESLPHSRVRRENPRHVGAASLEVMPDTATSLSGYYWTDRESAGVLEFARHVSKRARGYQEAISLFEVE